MYNQGYSFDNDIYNNRDDVSDLMIPIKVLVVDHKIDWTVYVSELLHSSFFEVAHVDHSFEAMILLFEKKSDYDLLLISHDVSHVGIQTLLRQTNDVDLLSIVMSDQEDDAFVLDVFKSGAFLVLKTPLTTDALKRVRQDVLRKRMHKLRKCEKNMTHKTATPEIEFSKWKYIGEKLTQAGPSNFDNNLVSESSDNGNDGLNGLKKRSSIEWTPELCEKFENVIIQLGERRCHPSEIHKLMNVPGLTKRQVSSHLQKYRNAIRKSKEKQTATVSLPNQSRSSNLSAQEFEVRKYGSASPLETYKADQAGGNDLIGINLSVNGCQAEVNNMLYQNDIHATLMYGSTQKNILQATEYTPFTYGNGLVPNQKEGFCRRITATTDFPQDISSYDAGQGVDYHPFPSEQKQAYDESLIYSNVNALSEDLFEPFSLGHDYVMQNEDTTGHTTHI